MFKERVLLITGGTGSFQQKVEFCDLLSSLKEVKKEDKNIERIVEYIRVNRGSSSDTSAMLGIVTAIMALLITTFVYMKDKEEFLAEGLSGITTVAPLMVLIMVLMITVPIMSVLLRDLLKRLKYIEPEITVRRGEKEKTGMNQNEPNKSIQPTADASTD